MEKIYYSKKRLSEVLQIDLATIIRFEKEYDVEKDTNGKIEYNAFWNLLNKVWDDISTKLEGKSVFTDKEIQDIFGCSMMQGMARSHKTNTLVLISDQSKKKENPYYDYWDNDVFYYTGMGTIGEQSLDWQQNKTLYRSRHRCIKVFLFTKIKERQINYYYQGVVSLREEPSQDIENDAEGNPRNVWKFPLIVQKSAEHEEWVVERLEKYKTRSQKCQANKLDMQSLYDKAKNAEDTIGERRNSTGSTKNPYKRNGFVAAYAIKRAKGYCECCEKKAPFSVEGEPYLESHHIHWLSKGGRDTIENVSGVCPNCHRKLHKLCLKEDVERVKENAKQHEKIMKMERREVED